jgi:hypothetical protein
MLPPSSAVMRPGAKPVEFYVDYCIPKSGFAQGADKSRFGYKNDK